MSKKYIQKPATKPGAMYLEEIKEKEDEQKRARTTQRYQASSYSLGKTSKDNDKKDQR